MFHFCRAPNSPSQGPKVVVLSQVYCATSGLMKNKGNFGEKPEMDGLKKHQMTALMHQPHLDRGGAQFSEHRPPLVPWCNRANPGDYICVYI